MIKILLVEDDKINQLVIRKYLKQIDAAHFEIAEDGETALEMVNSCPANDFYQIILMDLQLPGISGFEVTRQIRKQPDERFQKVPIIALTASIDTEDNEELKTSGLNDFILKPFEPDFFQDKIKYYANYSG